MDDAVRLRPAARTAGGEDDDAVARLRAMARAELVVQRGGAELLDDLPQTAPGTVLLGTIGGRPVGLLDLDVVTCGRSRMLALFVEPAARRVGVGAALVDAALDLCRAAGSTSVDAEALPGDRATKNFFEAYAFTTRRLTVRRSLAPED